MSDGQGTYTQADLDAPAQPAGKFTAADVEPDHENPEGFWRQVYDRSGLGAIQKLSASLADWAKKKAYDQQTQSLTDVAQGKPKPAGNDPGAGYDFLARGAQMLSSSFEPKSLAISGGVAAANTNPFTGIPVDAALIAHGAVGVAKNTPEALKGNPDAARDALLSGAEMAGGGAGAASFSRPSITPAGRLSEQIAHARAMDATAGTPARAEAAIAAGSPETAAVQSPPATTGTLANVSPKFLAARAAVKAASEAVSPIEPFSALTKAIKPGTNLTGWDKALKSAAPDLQAAEQASGKPIDSLRALSDGIKTAKKSIWAQYQQQLGPNSSATIDGASVAQAMKDSVNARFRVQYPDQAAAIDKVADTYNHPLSLAESEDYLQSANDELHSYYAKNKVSQSVAKSDPAVAHVVAEADALREGLYSKLDSITGSNAAALKRRYGALSTLEEPVLKRVNVWERQQPDTLQEQVNLVQGAAKIGKSVLNAKVGDALEGAGQMATSKFMKQRGDSNWLVKHAFDQLRNPSAAKPAGTPLPLASLPSSAVFSVAGARENENE